MFHQAKEYGDELIAVVSRDKTTEDIKGNTPYHTHEERKEFLRELRSIDTVLSGNEHDVYAVVRDNKPDVIAIGYDQKVFVDELADKITEFGLETEIVRLSPYRPEDQKTGKIKEYLAKCC
jgi:FAD synthetase